MRMTRLYMPTLREAPADSEIASHQLLLRSGMIRKLASGVYSYLPLGKRVLDKIEKIVREEMDGCGSQEVLMSAIQPAELWQESGRWDVFGPEMFRLKDRNERGFCLGLTHEEIFTDLIRYEVKSYKQLPLSLYQIQAKYRDEQRPRFGLVRARESIMKDAYTFDKDPQGMAEACKIMMEAYKKVFDRLHLKHRVVESDSGAMGYGDSHEFVAMSETGETKVIYCEGCDYAATDQKAACVLAPFGQEEAQAAMEKVHTPDVGTIEALEEFLGVGGENFAKTLLLQVNDQVLAVMLPGHREMNLAKLMKHIGAAEQDILMADEETVQRVSGAKVGFAGPVGLKEKVRILLDSRVATMKNMIVGANESDYHLKNVNYPRDFDAEVVEDLVLAVEGDLCPRCGKALLMDQGIEVGNIVQLGTHYSDGLHAAYLDENGKEQKLWMGSHGIGVSRSMAAVVEQYHDDMGICWPLVSAPYHVLVTIVNVRNEAQRTLGEAWYEKLQQAGIEVLLDDRNERPGVKFNDADLIGIPIRINVGRRASENIVEFSLRKDRVSRELAVEEIPAAIRAAFEAEGLRCSLE